MTFRYFPATVPIIGTAVLFLTLAAAGAQAQAQQSRSEQISMSQYLQTKSKARSPQRLPAMSDAQLLTEVQHRAFQFFWEKSDPSTGLTNDRAHNVGPDDTYMVASIASTGYALASLPVAVEHKWITR